MSFTPIAGAGIGSGTKATAGAGSGAAVGASFDAIQPPAPEPPTVWPIAVGFGYSEGVGATPVAFLIKGSTDPDGWSQVEVSATTRNAVAYKSVAFAPDGRIAAMLRSFALIATQSRVGQSSFALAGKYAYGPADGESCAFSPDGSLLVVGLAAAPWIEVYSHDGAGGLELIGPASGAAAAKHRRMAWSPDGSHLAVGLVGFPHIAIYKRSGSTLTKLPNPSILPGFTGGAVTTGESWPIWTPDGAWLICGSYLGGTTKLIYQRSGDTFTKITQQQWDGWFGGLMGGCWSPDGRYLYQGCTRSPYIAVFTYSEGVLIAEGGMQPMVALPGEAYALAYAEDANGPGADQLIATHFKYPNLTILNMTTLRRPSDYGYQGFELPSIATQCDAAGVTVWPAPQPIPSALPPAGIGAGA